MDLRFEREVRRQLERGASIDDLQRGIITIAVQRRQESLRQFLEQPGFLVRVVFPPGEVVQFRFDPEDRIDPGGPRFIHGRFLELELAGGRFRAHGAPSMTVYGTSPVDLREVSFVAGDDATWTLNGSLFYPRPGSMNAPEGIRIEGPGFELEGGSAHLYMSGQSVEVSFNPAPEPGSGPGTP